MLNNSNNNALMEFFKQNFVGKTDLQQMETLINMARAKGIDINEKRFTREYLQNLGLKI